MSAAKKASKRTKTASKNARLEPPGAATLDARLIPLWKAFRDEPGVTAGGKGFGSGALKVNGKIFAMVTPRDEFVVKLPKARVTELVDAGKGRYFDTGAGRIMKEWLTVTAPPNARRALAAEALAFVSGS